MKRPVNDSERSWLGLDTLISRRDFLNGSLVAAGGAVALPGLRGFRSKMATRDKESHA
jgi:hypothetical protein